MDVAVLGSGSWGTALAILLARNGHDVLLLGRDESERHTMRETRQNERYLPGFELPFNVQVESIEYASRPEMLVVAVPSSSVADALEVCRARSPVTVIAAKGLEQDSGRLMADIVKERLPKTKIAVLSGPNLAVEIARGIPTVAMAASRREATAALARDAFSCATFRVSITRDVVGVELAGALKNVLAIGAGMSDGLGFGDNTKAALLSRGLIEMSRLGIRLGARLETFLGPAGVGDLFATAVSRLSRNYRVGRSLGEGKRLEEALAEIGQVAEGVPTSKAVVKLAKEKSVDMPIFAAIDAVIGARLEPRAAVAMLMERGSSMSHFH